MKSVVAAGLCAACQPGDATTAPPVHAIFSDAQAVELRQLAAQANPYCPSLWPIGEWYVSEGRSAVHLAVSGRTYEGDVAAMACEINRFAAEITTAEDAANVWSDANELYILLAFAWARGADVGPLLDDACRALGTEFAEGKAFRAARMAVFARNNGHLTTEEADAAQRRAGAMPECDAVGALSDRIVAPD